MTPNEPANWWEAAVRIDAIKRRALGAAALTLLMAGATPPAAADTGPGPPPSVKRGGAEAPADGGATAPWTDPDRAVETRPATRLDDRPAPEGAPEPTVEEARPAPPPRDADEEIARRLILEVDAILKSNPAVGRPITLDRAAPSLRAAIARAQRSNPYLELRPARRDDDGRQVARAAFDTLEARLISIGDKLVIVPNARAEAGARFVAPVELLEINGAAPTDLADALEIFAGERDDASQMFALTVRDRGKVRVETTPVALDAGEPRPRQARFEIRRSRDALIVAPLVFESDVLRTAILEELRAAPPGSIKKIVFDLRVSVGGAFFDVVDLLQAFATARGPVLQVVPELAGRREFAADKAGLFASLDVEVWISAYTYSSAEILAHGLKSLRGAKVIGAKTGGKCVVQKNVKLSNGDTLLVPIAELRDRFGEPCHQTGVIPTHAVAQRDVFAPDFPPAAFFLTAAYCSARNFEHQRAARDAMPLLRSGMFVHLVGEHWRICSTRPSLEAARRHLPEGRVVRLKL